jgi:hypothetical protein
MAVIVQRGNLADISSEEVNIDMFTLYIFFANARKRFVLIFDKIFIYSHLLRL